MTYQKYTVLITGATRGIGYATAQLFLHHRQRFGHVIVHGRTAASVQEARDQLVAATQCPPDMISTVFGDLISRSQVHAMAKQIAALAKPIDVLINNAGAYPAVYSGVLVPTANLGDVECDVTFLQNHAHVVLLTLLVLPLMSPDARIVFVASSLYKRAADALPDLIAETKRLHPTPTAPYNGARAYSVSKLYSLQSAHVLASILRDPTTHLGSSAPFLASALLTSARNVSVVSVCPGFIPTTQLKRQSGLAARLVLDWVFPWLPFATSLENGVRRVWFAATEEISEEGLRSGALIEHDHPPRAVDMLPCVTDPEAATRVWNQTVELDGVPEWKVLSLSSSL
ncbi:hypothetical protein BC828DRAFT_403395 [Blastocladiella britannica]|nr:hypothetical protein BC828DRAFT_403395 [Blastocladiella britannica]